MPHMIPAYQHASMWRVETACGTETVPADLVGTNPAPEDFAMYLEGRMPTDAERAEFELVTGWFARLSAPGYMDCTEWSGPYETEQGARDYIESQYDVNAETGEELS